MFGPDSGFGSVSGTYIIIFVKSGSFDEFSTAHLQDEDSGTDSKIDVISTTDLTISVRLTANIKFPFCAQVKTRFFSGTRRAFKSNALSLCKC